MRTEHQAVNHGVKLQDDSTVCAEEHRQHQGNEWFPDSPILPTVPVPLACSLGTATLSAQLYSHLKGKEQGYADGKRKRNSIHPLLQLMLTILM